ncbi:hypothetical protein DSM25559_5363 [Agrobacterium rosae]|uniref:Transposase n=1 Tax=Agrobacterium rosae TaxID=1972867 RepID=A0A1R3U565_9HYPH|nr:hypothetical protein DSM25559_5363 [Agrobacterium rosae]
MFPARGFEVDHRTVNRWVLAYAPMTEQPPGRSADPIGKVRIDEASAKIRDKWISVPILRQARQSGRFSTDCKARSPH